MDPQWLEWAKKLQATAQNGLMYSENPFDQERYKDVRDVAAEILAGHSSLEPERIADLFDAQTGYATPKVDVRGAVFRENRILLVKEKLDGRWTMPGGWADVTESPSEAVVREVYEEAGYQTRAVKLLALFDRSRQAYVRPYPFHVYKLFFLCELLGGSPAASIETEGADFFDENQLPELSLGRNTPKQIARMFEHLRNPDLPTDFD